MRTCVREYQRVSVGPLSPRLETGSPSLATAAAYELAQLNLADALRLCLVYVRADRSRFDRAIVRWHARLCLDAKGLDPATAHAALTAATASPAPTATSPHCCSPQSLMTTNCPRSPWSSTNGLTKATLGDREAGLRRARVATESVERQAALYATNHARLLGAGRALLAEGQAVRADDAGDLAVLDDRLPGQRGGRVPWRPGPQATATASPWIAHVSDPRTPGKPCPRWMVSGASCHHPSPASSARRRPTCSSGTLKASASSTSL
jgi:hypothetical protein